MNGPSLGYLNMLGAGLDLLPAAANPPQPTLDLPADTITPTGTKMAPAPAVFNAPSGQAWVPPTDPLTAGYASPNANKDWLHYDPSVPIAPDTTPVRDVTSFERGPVGGGAPDGARNPISFARTDPTTGGDEPIPTPAPGPSTSGPVQFSADTASGLPDVSYSQVSGGGVTPAHEAYTRGPKQDAHLMASFEPEPEAATRGDFRNQLQASAEQGFYEDQARQAIAQQEAAQKVAAQRAFQMEQMELDYADQIQKLGQMRYDDNRWWSEKSTLGKIGTTLLVALGSLEALGNGGVNQAYNAVVGEIDRDAADQRLQYESGLAQAQGKHTAFQMMMQRFQNEDAAEAAVRAAGLQAAESKLGALHAQYGGVESANAADMLRAQFEAAREKTISNGFKFVPATTAAPRFQVTVRGHTLPGTFDEKGAQAVGLEHAVKPAEKMDETIVKGNIDSRLQNQKYQAEERLQDKKLAVEQKTKAKENPVALPNGEVVYAPSSQEADKLREISTNASNIKRLVTEAKGIREKAVTGVPMTPAARGRLKQIQADLVTSFGVQNKLGALSNQDMELAVAGTADLFNYGNGVEARLDRLNEQAIGKVRDRVKTYPGSAQTAPKASGKLPPSAKYPGEK